MGLSPERPSNDGRVGTHAVTVGTHGVVPHITGHTAVPLSNSGDRRDVGNLHLPMGRKNSDMDRDSSAKNADLHMHTCPHIPTPARKGCDPSVVTPSPIRRPQSTPIAEIGNEWTVQNPMEASPPRPCLQPQPRRPLPSSWNLNMDEGNEKGRLHSSWTSNNGDVNDLEERMPSPLIIAATPDLDDRRYTFDRERFPGPLLSMTGIRGQERVVPVQAMQTPSPMYCGDSLSYRDYGSYPNGYDSMWSQFIPQNGARQDLLHPYYQEAIPYNMLTGQQGCDRNWWDSDERSGQQQHQQQHPHHHPNAHQHAHQQQHPHQHLHPHPHPHSHQQHHQHQQHQQHAQHQQQHQHMQQHHQQHAHQQSLQQLSHHQQSLHQLSHHQQQQASHQLHHVHHQQPQQNARDGSRVPLHAIQQPPVVLHHQQHSPLPPMSTHHHHATNSLQRPIGPTSAAHQMAQMPSASQQVHIGGQDAAMQSAAYPPHVNAMANPLMNGMVNPMQAHVMKYSSTGTHDSTHNPQNGGVRDDEESAFDIDQNTPELPTESRDLVGEVVGLAKTQQGSKYLQRFLTEGTAEIIHLILQEVEPALALLMCDKYANYLCSEVFTACDHKFRRRMLDKIAPRLAQIACDKRGTHALQALIQVLGANDAADLDNLMDEQVKFVQALNADLVSVAKDPNGTHAIQKTIQCFRYPSTSVIFAKVIDNFLELARQPHGLCVLKVCISNCHNDHRPSLLHQLSTNALDLVQSPYGNYAVQHVLEEYGWEECASVLEALKQRYAQLSVQKFSSNVVEKILMLGPTNVRKDLIEELIRADRMSVLVSSVYGQYVVKRALEVSDDEQVRELVTAISMHLGQVANRRLRSKWEKMIHHIDKPHVENYHDHGGRSNNMGHVSFMDDR
eukprot:GEMP01007295.1.p1 GENE.GEMP01007295.1~~GEMP01007295.1.p1  ORF type:complete len:895 (+),score=191.43 GEMP01007295.1:90-2774(+)